MTEAKSTPKRRVKLLLDYDGCCDVLFWKTFTKEHYKKRHQQIYTQRKQVAPEFTEQIMQEMQREYEAKAHNLMAFLDQITKGAEVEVAVWSNRQEEATNQEGASQNLNGDCFANFAALCQQEKWHFNRLLVSDVLLKKEAGTVMGNGKKEPINSEAFSAIREFKENRYTRPDKYQKIYKDEALKAYILDCHFSKLSGPTEEDWYALDDREDLLGRTKDFVEGGVILSVPKGIRLNIYRYQHAPAPFSKITETPEQFSVHGRAQAETKPINSDTQLSEDSLYARTCGFFKTPHPGVKKVAIFSAIELLSVAGVYTVAAAAGKVDAVHGFMSAVPWNNSGIEKLATPITPYSLAFLLCVICVGIYESRKSRKELETEVPLEDSKQRFVPQES